MFIFSKLRFTQHKVDQSKWNIFQIVWMNCWNSLNEWKWTTYSSKLTTVFYVYVIEDCNSLSLKITNGNSLSTTVPIIIRLLYFTFIFITFFINVYLQSEISRNLLLTLTVIEHCTLFKYCMFEGKYRTIFKLFVLEGYIQFYILFSYY